MTETCQSFGSFWKDVKMVAESQSNWGTYHIINNSTDDSPLLLLDGQSHTLDLLGFVKHQQKTKNLSVLHDVNTSGKAKGGIFTCDLTHSGRWGRAVWPSCIPQIRPSTWTAGGTGVQRRTSPKSFPMGANSPGQLGQWHFCFSLGILN